MERRSVMWVFEIWWPSVWSEEEFGVWCPHTRTDAITQFFVDSQYEKTQSMWKRKSKVWVLNTGEGENFFLPVSDRFRWQWFHLLLRRSEDVDGLLSRWAVGWIRLELGALDGFGWILFTDEDLQKPQFGFNSLVLLVFVHHRRAIFLLNIPVGGKTFWLRAKLTWCFCPTSNV